MNRGRIAAVGLAVLAVLTLGGVVGAASSPSYDIDWQALGSGGATASGATVVLEATLGQTAIGVAGSGSYQVSSGYSSDVANIGSGSVFLPVVVKE